MIPKRERINKSTSMVSGRLPYKKFLLRELTSFFIAIELAFFLVWIYKLNTSWEEYDRFMTYATSQPWAIFHCVALVMACFHSFTWFEAAPRLTPLWAAYQGEERLPDIAFIAPNLVAMAAATILILVVTLK